ncbi:hypothetical protein J4Q44_G00029450 [Coregonus suidteri]|uniref:Phostensin/Taperin PP1-binding domain-containing protein n=1 Tax=Coregonus suidteri TaxID=861788 RepID=A0AAN8M9K8_9TELE
MSVSSLPEWKQLLLERKRREEEEREKREKEEEAKLASMPAWKRGIIQRRRMKQESFGDKEREGPLQVKEGRSPSDPASDPDSSTLVQLGSEPPLSPDITGPWLDEEAKPQSQVLKEQINPVRQNPFIRTHGGWRRGREAERAGEMGHEKGNEQEIEVRREREKEKERGYVKGHDGESGKGRDIEIKIERYRDRSGGREKDRSAGRETSRDTVRDRERECQRERKEEEREEGDSDPPSPKYPHPLVPGLRTIRADNIIIIEQDRKGSDERTGRRRESEREREVMEEEQENRDVKMDLKEFLAGGGSVTEIRASEVLIIKPLAGTEDSRSGGLKGTGREGDGERGREAKCNKDGGKDCERELEREEAWLKDKERENLREKDRPRTQAASEKEDRRYGDTDDSIHNERGVRVSELLSKFGEHTKKFREHPKPPSRSKSSECFIRPGRDREKFCLDEDDDGDRRGEDKHAGFRDVPKRSFSFSERVICAKENGMQDEGNHDRKVVERTYSDRRVAARGDVVGGEWSGRGGKQGGWTWLSDKEQAGKHREGCIKADREVEGQHERQPALEIGIPPTSLEIHIPRTVFYGVGEASLQSEDDQSCEGEGGKGVERRDSWRIGKPSHIESLQEKIQQREKERLKNIEGVAATGDDGDATEGMEKSGTRSTRKASSSDWYEEGERGNEMERERQRQEGSAPQTTSTQFDVTQEVSVSKAVPQLPVPLSFLQAVKGEKETGVISITASEVALFSSHATEREEDPTKHVVEELRSSSGGQQVKRGTTITITPRKPVGGAAVEAVSVSSGPPAKTSSQAQMPVLTEVVERGKKRYPTVEEIEVIGGYQNLDKSCLVKTPKATPKGVKVCFDETQLEQVCEYPSETSMLASTPYPLPGQEEGREEEVQEEEEEEEEEERGVLVSRSSRNVGAAAGLRVDESCHR